jgi:GTPase
MLGEARSIVDATPGTTRDPVDSVIAVDDERALRLVDTAGMRRQVQIRDAIEYFSFLRSRNTLGRVDVAILVIDASEGVTGHDQRIAQEILEAGRACVVVLNKWDLVTGEEADRRRFEHAVKTKLRFVTWAPLLRVSAKTGRGIHRLLPAVDQAVAAHRTRLETAMLNKLIGAAQERRPHPRTRGRSVRILYAVQASVGPPTFVFFTSARLSVEYLRYLDNQIRDTEPFGGTPLRLEQRSRSRHKVDT